MTDQRAGRLYMARAAVERVRISLEEGRLGSGWVAEAWQDLAVALDALIVEIEERKPPDA